MEIYRRPNGAYSCPTNFKRTEINTANLGIFKKKLYIVFVNKSVNISYKHDDRDAERIIKKKLLGEYGDEYWSIWILRSWEGKTHRVI